MQQTGTQYASLEFALVAGMLLLLVSERLRVAHLLRRQYVAAGRREYAKNLQNRSRIRTTALSAFPRSVEAEEVYVAQRAGGRRP